jgi:hypothetical protein
LIRALLNALGATLWGSIAIVLAVALATFGYRASLYYRDSHAVDVRTSAAAALSINPLTAPAAAPPALTAPEATARAPIPRIALTSGAARTRFYRAAQDQHYAEAAQYGQELYDTGTATADDLALIGHFFYLQHDCRNAALWVDRAVDTARANGAAYKQYLVKSPCAFEAGGNATMTTTSARSTNPVPIKRQEISRVIGKEMAAAQQALQAQRWQEALNNLDAAEHRSPLTAFDETTIYDFKGVAYVKLNNLKAAQGEFEKALATGAATSEEAAHMTRTLFAIAASTQQYQTTIDYGKQLVDAGTATPDNMTIIAQSYYLLKDCKNSIAWADKAVAATRRAGETPKENLFLFKLQCASDAGNTPAMAAVLMDLIRLNNKASYWNTLLRIERQDERDDHNTLMIYRIMYNTNSMNADTDYIEMAQLLGDAALPGEAATVLDKAMSTGVIKDEHKERTTRLLNSLKTRADADKKGLAQEDAEASKSAAGELDVRLGEMYYGFGDYQMAADAITRGLQEGQIQHLDEAYVYLGLALAALNNRAAARGAFVRLTDVPNVNPRVLRLWRLYSDSLM